MIFGAVEGPKIGAKIFEGVRFKLRHQRPPLLSSINTHLVPKLGTGRTSFAPEFYSLLILEKMKKMLKRENS